ncbi:hypothetical protein SESBI_24521 [Sesbania bispinosa]|nr:hypothetical protein SESBI_24521 [Sesbania bispinosa]
MALVSGAFHMISSLCGRRQSWRLRVKLVRAWNMCSLAKPDDPFALEMVFIDEEATVAKQHMMRFAQAVVEGQVYRLTNFGLTANSGKFRAAAHEFKLVFNVGTRLIPCHSVPIPLSGLSLVKSSETKETNGCSNFLLDFMGVLTAVSEEINMKKQGRETRLMLLDLVDEGAIRCAIFGDMVDVVAGFINVPRSGLPVVIIQFAKINTYKGVVGIQNVMNASKISWNPDLPEAIEFKNGLAVHEIETNVSIGFISDRSRHVSIKEEFLSIFPKKTIGQLHLTHEDGCFIVMGIIEEVILEENWWYFACLCMKALSFDLGVPYCRDCKKVVFEMNPRFKLKIVVSDGVDCVQLIMFDAECYSLLNKYCRELLTEIKGHPSETYPPEIMELIGMEFLFKVESNEESLFQFDDSYRVKRVCFDKSIIEEYKGGIDEETPLKLKFTPHFPKLADVETNACVMEISPQGNSIITDTEANGISCPPSTSGCEDSVGPQKRLADPPCDVVPEKKKETRQAF